MKHQSRVTPFSPAAKSCWPRGPPTQCGRLKRRFAQRATNAFRLATVSKVKLARLPPSTLSLARKLRAQDKRAVIISGGELTVTIRGKGRGGPNQEYALALAIALAGMPAVAALAGDTDGTDGGSGAASDPAGALVDGESVARAKARGLDPAAFLADNNSKGVL